MKETAIATKVKKRAPLDKNVDMLSGKILPNFVKFTLPIILTGFLQQFYNTADSIVVGNFGGKEALAAVGATTQIISVLVAVFINIFIGTNILVARSKGAGDDDTLRKVVSTTYIMSLVMGIVLMIAGQLLARPLLELTKCPENIIDSSESYLRIYFLGVPASMFFNFGASVLRNSGDSRSPFIYLSISGVANVVLNIVFVLTFGNAVVSVALATVVSMYMSAIQFFIHLVRMKGACKLYPFKFKFDFQIFIKTIRYGIPSVISAASFSLTNVIIAPTINSYGDVGISGSTAAGSIESFLYAITSSFSAATSAFMGQNIGAGNKERTVKVLKTGYAIAVCSMAVFTVLIIGLGRELLYLFIPGETEAIEFGRYRMIFIMSASVMNGIMNINAGAIQSYGYTTLQMLSNLIGVCLFRIGWMTLVYPQSPSPTMLWICYPVSWTLTALVLLAIVIVMTKKYLKGKNFRI